LSKHHSNESNEIEIITSIGVPVQEQHLVFDGKPMNPINTLSNHGVGPGSTIHMVLRARGGGC